MSLNQKSQLSPTKWKVSQTKQEHTKLSLRKTQINGYVTSQTKHVFIIMFVVWLFVCFYIIIIINVCLLYCCLITHLLNCCVIKAQFNKCIITWNKSTIFCLTCSMYKVKIWWWDLDIFFNCCWLLLLLPFLLFLFGGVGSAGGGGVGGVGSSSERCVVVVSKLEFPANPLYSQTRTRLPLRIFGKFHLHEQWTKLRY